TREAGVRKLEQLIGTVCRKQARRIAEGKTGTLVVDRAVIQEFLGGIKVRGDNEFGVGAPGARGGGGRPARAPAGGGVVLQRSQGGRGQGRRAGCPHQIGCRRAP